MKKQHSTLTERMRYSFHTHVKIPLGVKIAISVFPAVLTALFYILRSSKEVMDWVIQYISTPIRVSIGFVSSIYPLALMEVICTFAGIYLIYYIVKAIRNALYRREKWKLLGKQALKLLVVVCYIWGMFCWLWNSGYHATGFAERYNLTSTGVETADLIAVTEMFANRANELSVQIERDEDGNIIFNRSEVFAQSRYIYRNISKEFPSLSGRVYAPKPMIFYSWLMTITGYTGMYLALTGEAMINTQPHKAFMPATIAHEHAHQLGVFAEDEASFVGILACVTSGNPTFEYAGYMTGLHYLSSALWGADSDEYERIMSKLTYEVKLDRAQNHEFWMSATRSDFGLKWLDDLLSSLMRTTSDTVDTVYDSFLKSQDQELGIRSYGACVDLLVKYFTSGVD